jgi:hypothetical protein
LSPDDVQRLSGALFDLSNGSERLANAALGHEFPKDSAASKWELDWVNQAGGWRGSTAVSAALRALFFTELAAFDHMRAFAAGLRGRRPATVALASTARGALEAFARINYVVRVGSARELVKRHGGLELTDLTYLIEMEDESDSPALQFWADGAEIGATELKATVERDLKALRIPVKMPPNRSTLTRQLLDTALGRTGGRVRYSTISAVAHGESYAVNAFAVVQKKDIDGVAGSSVTFRTPRDFAIDYALFVGASCVAAQEQLIEKCSPSPAEVDRWVGVKERVISQLHTLATSR